jgi:hypothetical protein
MVSKPKYILHESSTSYHVREDYKYDANSCKTQKADKGHYRNYILSKRANTTSEVSVSSATIGPTVRLHVSPPPPPSVVNFSQNIPFSPIRLLLNAANFWDIA